MTTMLKQLCVRGFCTIRNNSNIFIKLEDEMAGVVEIKYVTDTKLVEDVGRLFLEYAGTLGIDLCFQNFNEELENLPGKYSYPDGALLIALVDGKDAGCAALRKISNEVCEMKRLYVSDKYRGFGIGKMLLSEIIDRAVKLRYEFIRLDTLPDMKSAQKMYERFGFYDIDPYVYNPVKGARYMELKLVK